jgi:hypothetical protein
MSISYTVPVEQGRAQLQRIADIADVRHVAVLDAVGLCLLHSGHEPVSTMLLTGWTVVARAAFSACDDLGQRGGSGPCQESLQTHAEGGTLMRALRGGMLLIVQYGKKTPVGSLRILAIEVGEALPVAVEPRVSPQPAHSAPVKEFVSNDPFANPWAAEAPVTKKHVVLEAECL